MPTQWFYPFSYSFHQIDDTDVAWLDDFTHVVNEDKIGTSSGILQSRHNDLAGGHIRNKTELVKLSNFNFSNLPDVINGIELHISCNKNGRILEDTLHFSDVNELISDSKFSWNGRDLEYFHANFDNEAYYGGPTDTWGLDVSQVVFDSDFTLNLRYQSHFFFPHKSCIIIDTVRIRFY
jgi:hypothetical protein